MKRSTDYYDRSNQFRPSFIKRTKFNNNIQNNTDNKNTFQNDMQQRPQPSIKPFRFNTNRPNNNNNDNPNYNRFSNNNNNNNANYQRRNTFNRQQTTSENFSQLNRSIVEYFNKNAQTFECYQRKQQLKDVLVAMFKDIFPYLGIYIVGSSANGFGSNKSDVDMCLMVSHEEIDQKTEAHELLKLLAKALRKAGFIKNLILINAKVPIIKFHDCYNRIDCDLNINNHIGIRNTHLLKCYSDLDWRVRPFVLIIKRWAKFHDINDASKKTISSYSIVLMSIFYLQSVCKPAILPVLQQLYPEKFNIRSNICELSLNEDLGEWKSENQKCLGELFLGFLEYYSNFDYRNNIISIRAGTLFNYSEYLRNVDDMSRDSWKYLCIEEPFEMSNTARSVYDYQVFQRVLRVIRKSHHILSRSKNLDDLFHEKFEAE